MKFGFYSDFFFLSRCVTLEQLFYSPFVILAQNVGNTYMSSRLRFIGTLRSSGNAVIALNLGCLLLHQDMGKNTFFEE